MPVTFSFTAVTVPVGETDIDLGSADDADAQFLLTIDRTPDGGLNSLDGSTTITVMVSQSINAGETWDGIAGCTWAGGINLDRHGQPRTFETVQSWLMDGTSRLMKVTVTVNGPSPVAVAGSIATT